MPKTRFILQFICLSVLLSASFYCMFQAFKAAKTQQNACCRAMQKTHAWLYNYETNRMMVLDANDHIICSYYEEPLKIK